MKAEHGGDIYSYDRELLDFSVNVNPLGVPDKVLKSVIDGVKNLALYPDIICRELIFGLSLKENIPSEHIVCGNGGAELIYNAAVAICPRKTLVTAPTFSEYGKAAESVGSAVVFYKKKEENGFKINEDILEYIDAELDMMFLCDPDNPVGSCMDRELLGRIAEKCEKENVFLFIDNCFADFAENYDDISAVGLTGRYKNIFVLKSFTKMFSIPAIRLGYGICGDVGFIERIALKRQPWSVSGLAQAAGKAALLCVDFEEKTREYVKRERKFLETELGKMSIKYFPSQTNYILFKCKVGLYDDLLKKNILIRKCDNFKCLNEQFYRIAVKQHKDNVFLINAIRESLRKR